jgi:chromosome segregation ATPase
MLRQYDIILNQNTELVREFQKSRTAHEEVVAGLHAKISAVSPDDASHEACNTRIAALYQSIADADVGLPALESSGNKKNESVELMTLLSVSCSKEVTSVGEGVKELIGRLGLLEDENARVLVLETKFIEENNQLQCELDGSRKKSEELGDEYARLQEMVGEVNGVREELARVRNEMGDAAKEMGAKKEELENRHELARDEFKNVWSDLQTRLDESIANNSSLEEQAKVAKDALLARDKEAVYIQKKVGDGETRNSELEKQVVELKEGLERLVSENGCLAGKTELAVNERKRHTNLEQEFILLEMEKTRLETRIEAIEAEFNGACVDDGSTRIGELEMEKIGLQTRIVVLENMVVDDGSKKIEELELEVKALTTDYEEILEEKRDADARVVSFGEVERKLVEMEKEREDYRREIRELVERLQVAGGGEGIVSTGYMLMVWGWFLMLVCVGGRGLIGFWSASLYGWVDDLFSFVNTLTSIYSSVLSFLMEPLRQDFIKAKNFRVDIVEL